VTLAGAPARVGPLRRHRRFQLSLVNVRAGDAGDLFGVARKNASVFVSAILDSCVAASCYRIMFSPPLDAVTLGRIAML